MEKSHFQWTNFWGARHGKVDQVELPPFIPNKTVKGEVRFHGCITDHDLAVIPCRLYVASETTWNMDIVEDSISQDEAALAIATVGVGVIARDVAGIVNPPGCRRGCVGEVDLRELSIVQQESMVDAIFENLEPARNVGASVDGTRYSQRRVWEIDG